MQKFWENSTKTSMFTKQLPPCFPDHQRDEECNLLAEGYFLAALSTYTLHTALGSLSILKDGYVGYRWCGGFNEVVLGGSGGGK